LWWTGELLLRYLSIVSENNELQTVGHFFPNLAYFSHIRHNNKKFVHQAALDLVTLLVTIKTVTNFHTVTKYKDFLLQIKTWACAKIATKLQIQFH
jgi:hypothetical protein